MSNKPLYYVHGNHDESYDTKPPLGCDSLDDEVIVYRGLRILGLGGSMRYKKGPNQYTQNEMKKRVRKLSLKLFFSNGFDILVTHAPAYQLNDGDDLPHRGFMAFNKLLDKYRPKYFLHGHVHLSYGGKSKRISQYNDTTVINAYSRHIFEY